MMGENIRMTADFSSRNHGDWKEVERYFQVLKKVNQILHPEKTLFKNENEINTFSKEGETRTYLQ